MFTLNELNLVCGMGWEVIEPVHIIFHEQDEGFTHEVTIQSGHFHKRFSLQTTARTAHLPAILSFDVTELRLLFYKLKSGYKDVNVTLPLKFSRSGIEVMAGPGRGTTISAKL